jgi:two-component SAPR family response regulator
MSARTLILEDDSHLRGILSGVLTHQGYEVVATERGSDAVELALRQEFDLIVADIRMEGMDGLEAVRRAKEQQPTIGTLIVSGYASEEETARAERLQVGGYMKKPFRRAEFLERVRQLLSERANATQRQDRGDRGRDAVLWALEQMLVAVDQGGEAGPAGWLEGVGQTARDLAGQLGMMAEVKRELGVAAGLQAWSRATNQKVPPLLAASGLLPTFPVLFRESAGALPLESALVDLAVVSSEWLRDQAHHPSAQSLDERHPGRYVSPLLQAYARLADSPEGRAPEEPVAPTRAGVSAYSLASALERGGDLEGAARAYQRLCDEDVDTSTRVRALLGAGRLAWRAGRRDQGLALVESGYQKAARFGPTVHALAGLEWGLMLKECGRPEAQEILASAVSYLQTLELWPDWTRGLLALYELQGEMPDKQLRHLEELADKSRTFLAGEHLAFTLPTLLKLYKQGVIRKPAMFSRLIQSSPRRLEQLLPSLEEGQRLTLVEALVEAGKTCPEDLIRALEVDPSQPVREAARDLISSTTGEVAPDLLRLFSLGVFQVFRGEERIPDSEFKTQKNLYLLAYLAGDKGRPKPVEGLIEQFWPDKGQKGKASLNWTVSTLRSLFRTATSDVIVRDADKLYIDPKVPRWHDLDELEEALRNARQADTAGDTSSAWRYYRRVAELYRGTYLEGCYMDWALQRQTRITEVLTDAFFQLAKISREAGQHLEALSAVGQLLEFAPQLQKAHLLKMQLHLAAGEPAEAVAHYRRCEELLRVEYELEPSTDILRAYHEARLSL